MSTRIAVDTRLILPREGTDTTHLRVRYQAREIRRAWWDVFGMFETDTLVRESFKTITNLEESKMIDPWKHRSAGLACKTCMWFVPKTTVLPGTIDGENPVINLGRCRRHAPTMTGYPVVFVNDWCGDHRLDENKVGDV